ncbi:hypothetical protein ACTJIJ_06215 [Niabella sp. 22666]|uniref:hypothetical protein n=1 Tax=Niabella sp. 22666 TaxID=3453954 RepID=UPI003F85F309
MLTLEQIQRIDWFFESNGLELKDLRMELVDHVSEAIEYSMKMNAGQSFDQAFEAETGRFDKKEFPVKNYEALLQSHPIKESQYFTVNKVVSLVLIFLLLIAPVFFLNYRLLVYIEMVYILAGTSWYLYSLLQFKRKYKESPKQLGLYFSGDASMYLFYILYLAYLFLEPLFKGKELIQDKSEWMFVLFVLLQWSLIVAHMAKLHAKKRQYNAAKKAYPLLFEN